MFKPNNGVRFFLRVILVKKFISTDIFTLNKISISLANIKVTFINVCNPFGYIKVRLSAYNIYYLHEHFQLYNLYLFYLDKLLTGLYIYILKISGGKIISYRMPFLHMDSRCSFVPS